METIPPFQEYPDLALYNMLTSVKILKSGAKQMISEIQSSGNVMNKVLGDRRKKVHLLVRDTLFAANLHKNAGIINRNRNNSASCTDNKRITLKISEIREIAI